MLTVNRVLPLAALAIAVCCGGDGSSSSPTSPTAQGLPGTWRATRAEFVSEANSSVRVEIISLGTTMVLVLETTGAYTLTITDPGQTGEVQTGAWSASRDVLTLRPSGVSFSIEFDMTMGGSTLTLAGGHVEFDVNDDDVDEQAVLNATLVRQ